jgi:hypothetical protein
LIQAGFAHQQCIAGRCNGGGAAVTITGRAIELRRPNVQGRVSFFQAIVGRGKTQLVATATKIQRQVAAEGVSAKIEILSLDLTLRVEQDVEVVGKVFFTMRLRQAQDIRCLCLRGQAQDQKAPEASFPAR